MNVFVFRHHVGTFGLLMGVLVKEGKIGDICRNTRKKCLVFSEIRGFFGGV